MKVAFAGTPDFARVALAALHSAGFTIPLVLTQPDRPAGRGMKLQASPVKALASGLAIPVIQPRGLRLDGRHADDAAAARAALEAAAPDAVVVAAYGLILPRWFLGMPPLGCINIHASLLPRWRGAAPIHRAIEAGDAETGVTIMQMDEGLDTGPMLFAEPMPIRPDDDSATLQARLAACGGELVVDALRRLSGGGLTPRPQPEDGVTYASKVDKREASIDWSAPAVTIERRLRAFDPFPGASTTFAGETVKCWRGRVEAGSGAPGRVLRTGPGGIEVACGIGSLALTSLQRAGGRRLSAAEFLQRGNVEPGLHFGAPAV